MGGRGNIPKTVIDQLFSYPGREKSRRSLAVMRRIDDWLGRPHQHYSCIHIAGTNGKGSVAWKIAAALRHAGARTGLYLSPHLTDWRERISVNGELILEEFASQFLPDLFSFISREHIEPTFFELMTALCFAYFREERVEWAVLETGLGGRLDATNVIEPTLCVITSIDYDHTELLGFTLEEIAREKAGIIKQGVPVVIGPRASLIRSDLAISVLAEQDGFYDRENSAIASAALHHLNLPCEAIEQGLRVRPPCRFEVIGKRPIILDVAHNPDGFKKLNQALEEFYPGQRFRFVVALGQQRDPVACVAHIQEKASQILCVSNGHPRLRPASELAYLLHSQSTSLQEALEGTEPTVVCGSFYIMNDIRLEVLKHKCSFLSH